MVIGLLIRQYLAIRRYVDVLDLVVSDGSQEFLFGFGCSW